MSRALCLLLVTIAFDVRTPVLAQGTGTAPSVRACALLTKELVAKVSPHKGNTQQMTVMKPSEDSLGPNGSACSYAGITLQVNPFTAERLQALARKEAATWVPVPDVGTRAYLFDNQGEYAELYATTGTQVFTIQMDVPAGGTVAGMTPNVLELAKAIAAKLK